MAGNMSDFLENKLIDAVFRNQSMPTLTGMSIALSTGTLTDASTGASMTEVANSGSYARVALTPALTAWQATQGGNSASSGTNGTTSNTNALVFPAPTGNWGTITSFAIVDSATWGAGNILFWGALTASKTVNSGDGAPQFNASALTVQIDS